MKEASQATILLAALVGIAWLQFARPGADPGGLAVFAIILGVFAIISGFLAFLAGRVASYAWKAWDRLRRTGLRWALTHALLVVSLTLAVIAAVILTTADFVGSFAVAELPPDVPRDLGSPELTLGLIVLRYVPAALALFLLSIAVGVVVVPPVALIAFPVLGRATRRLEDLARATAALRAGDLGARTAVAGEDEIARLQGDFNAMAAGLQRAQEQLRAERDEVARLLDERRELVAAVSHELRTPVATVRGYLESALTHWEKDPPPTLRQDLAIMSGETERLQRLIDDLFTLSRAEVGRLPLATEPTAIAPLLQRSAQAAAPLAWERGRVEVLARVPGDLPTVLVDPVRLEQAVRNLINNAVRHTPPGGVVLVTTESSDGAVAIQVKDTGEGIPAADLPHIWDRFYRSSNVSDRDNDGVREGAGLGLALVKELTEAMGGSVQVESAAGQGSVFTLRLPIARDDVRHEQPAQREMRRGSRSSRGSRFSYGDG